MQYSTVFLAALLSLANAKVIPVEVGAVNGTAAQKFFPEKITAVPGDMIQFQFRANNHTVTQSNFDNPCEPIALHSNTTGVYSGFMPVTPQQASIPVFTVMVNDTKPLWFYCSQGRHCQNGMVMVVNENTAANSSRSLEQFKVLAGQATQNLPGTAVTSGGTGTGNGDASQTGGLPGAIPTGNFATSVFVPTALSFVGIFAALLM